MASLAGWLRVTAAAISFPAAWSALARKMPPTRDALATGKRPHLEPVHIPNDLWSQAPLVTRAFGQGLYTPRSGRALFFYCGKSKMPSLNVLSLSSDRVQFSPPAVPERVAPASCQSKRADPRVSALGAALATAPFLFGDGEKFAAMRKPFCSNSINDPCSAGQRRVAWSRIVSNRLQRVWRVRDGAQHSRDSRQLRKKLGHLPLIGHIHAQPRPCARSPAGAATPVRWYSWVDTAAVPLSP